MEKREDDKKLVQQSTESGVPVIWDAYTVFSLSAYVLLAAAMVGFAVYCILYGAPDIFS
jgi:hypothetical protein